jgi:P-type E1-E2 ATPase
METELEFVGITAIEDQLQEQVPETVEMLQKGGVKVWMLTGEMSSRVDM